MNKTNSSNTVGRILAASTAVLLMSAGGVMAGTAIEPQNAAQALLAPTISAPAHVAGTAGSHGIDKRDDAQEQARRLLVGAAGHSVSPHRIVVATAIHVVSRDDAGSLARRMILGRGV